MLKRKTPRYIPAILALSAGVMCGASALFAAPGDKPGALLPGTHSHDGEGADNTPYEIGADGRLTKKVVLPTPDSPTFAAFSQWLRGFNGSSPEQKKRLEAEGVELAKNRRQAMAELIPRDPARALELSIGLQDRKGLPAPIVQQLEAIIQGRADYGLIHSEIVEDVPVPGKPGETHKVARGGYQRDLTFGGRVYRAFVYGRRAGLLSKVNLPVYAIAVDKVAAIHESPIWVLAPGQAIPATATPSKSGTKSPISGKEAKDGIRGVVGSIVYYFETQEELNKFTEDLWAAENVVGPKEHG